MKRKKQTLAILLIALAFIAIGCEEKEPEKEAFKLNIGDTYEGGKIAYIFQVGENRYVEGETHGLIAASNDQCTDIEWGCSGIYIGETSTELGKGYDNTCGIVQKCTERNAAYLCDTLCLNGFFDWFLPSLEELHLLYTNREAIGGFSDTVYWSSSESSINDQYAWIMNFYSKENDNKAKNTKCYVRAIRYF
ncbi:MAG: DUF1566 domain-containing protein [Bacteroidales bacterium]|jgi:hypothetical protein|nr:DUF1566 domain-containing protein [Bacteroidales bacterium]